MQVSYPDNPKEASALRQLLSRAFKPQWSTYANDPTAFSLPCTGGSAQRLLARCAPYLILVQRAGREGWNAEMKTAQTGRLHAVYRLTPEGQALLATPLALGEAPAAKSQPVGMSTRVQLDVAQLALLEAEQAAFVDSLATDDEALDAAKAHLYTARTLSKLVDAEGNYTQQYESRHGRLTAVRGSLQSIPREWRARLLPGLSDWDIENCYYNILDQYYPDTYDAVHSYCTQRSSWFTSTIRDFQIPATIRQGKKEISAREYVKPIILSIVFGRKAPRVLQLLNAFLPRKSKLKELPTYLAQLILDMENAKASYFRTVEGKQALLDARNQHPPTQDGQCWNKHHKGGYYTHAYSQDAWENDCENTAFSTFFGTRETAVMQAFGQYVQSLGGDVALYMYDGAMVPSAVPVIAEDATAFVARVTGLHFTFSRKDASTTSQEVQCPSQQNSVQRSTITSVLGTSASMQAGSISSSSSVSSSASCASVDSFAPSTTASTRRQSGSGTRFFTTSMQTPKSRMSVLSLS